MSIFINGNPASGLPASYPSNRVTYDNTSSGLTADDVQGAIDEVNVKTENAAYKNVNNYFTANQTIDRANGTASALGFSLLSLGNNIAQGTDGNSTGVLGLYGYSGAMTKLVAPNSSAEREIKFPDASGTLAMTSDVAERLISITDSIAVSSSKQYTLTQSCMYLLFIGGRTNSMFSAYLINTLQNPTGLAYIPLMGTDYGADISLSYSGLTLTVTNAAADKGCRLSLIEIYKA